MLKGFGGIQADVHGNPNENVIFTEVMAANDLGKPLHSLSVN